MDKLQSVNVAFENCRSDYLIKQKLNYQKTYPLKWWSCRVYSAPTDIWINYIQYQIKQANYLNHKNVKCFWQKLGTSCVCDCVCDCVCWSLGHAEQLLFSCVSSKVCMSNVTYYMSNAYVDLWDMLNNFRFHVYAQMLMFMGENDNGYFLPQQHPCPWVEQS